MSRTDDILDAIDSAVADWTVGPDAVRVIPPGAEPSTASGPGPGSLNLGAAFARLAEVLSTPDRPLVLQSWQVAAVQRLADGHAELAQSLSSAARSVERFRQDLNRPPQRALSKAEYARRLRSRGRSRR